MTIKEQKELASKWMEELSDKLDASWSDKLEMHIHKEFMDIFKYLDIEEK